MAYYDNINALRFALAHRLRTDYGQDPADWKGLFSTEALYHRLDWDLSAEEILLKEVGPPTVQHRPVRRPA